MHCFNDIIYLKTLVFSFRLLMKFCCSLLFCSVKRDVLIYDGFDFIADFGGYMGILLGFSILSIFDVISSSIQSNSDKYESFLDDELSKQMLSNVINHNVLFLYFEKSGLESTQAFVSTLESDYVSTIIYNSKAMNASKWFP